MNLYTQRYIACRGCPRRQTGLGPQLLCLENGQTVDANARAGTCPLGTFTGPPARLAGDCVAAIATAIGADQAAKVIERLTGKPCGCEDRRAAINAAHAARIQRTMG